LARCSMIWVNLLIVVLQIKMSTATANSGLQTKDVWDCLLRDCRHRYEAAPVNMSVCCDGY